MLEWVKNLLDIGGESMSITLDEIKDAQKEWQEAHQEFMMAEPEFVEAAVFQAHSG